MLYLLKSGCQWRMLPSEYPKWRTVHAYFAEWSEPGPDGFSVLERALKKCGWRGSYKTGAQILDELFDRRRAEGGYKEFRQLQGRQTAFVDLRLSGSLETSIQLVKDGENAILIAITNEEEANKARENEKRFSKVVFSLSESEKKTFNEALLSGAEKVIKRALR